MRTLIILAAAVAACAFPRRPVPPEESGFAFPKLLPRREDYFSEYLAPRLLLPRYVGYDDSPPVPLTPPTHPDHEWLNKEIDRINQMVEDEGEDMGNSYEADLRRLLSRNPYLHRLLDDQLPDGNSLLEYAGMNDLKKLETGRYSILEPLNKVEVVPPVRRLPNEHQNAELKKAFALTPFNKEYFEPDTRSPSYPGSLETDPEIVLEPPRQIRQNPNLSRTKTLIAENINILRNGVANKEFKLPVSLLPSNLRWLKINDDKKESSGHEDGAATEHPQQVSMLEATEAKGSMYGTAVLAAVGSGLTIILVAFSFIWYSMSQCAKAAADVDYPAYGVTGPAVENTGDRKLAHSAQMYHYQHQKQQIIAMERNGMEQRNGSVSDPESEEENEEGDYTVYECPGFATTGDMEVKNPLFSDDPTPVTPGKVEVVKPQPKE